MPTLAEALAALPAGLTVAIDIKHASAAAAYRPMTSRQKASLRKQSEAFLAVA